jgi:membrane protease YdiL (CAAX protease family)
MLWVITMLAISGFVNQFKNMQNATFRRSLRFIRELPRSLLSTNIFLNSERQLRNGWWILIFFLIMASMLFPMLLMARQNGGDLAIWKQAIMVVIASYVLQLLRRKSMAELMGKFNFVWVKELLLGGLLGSALMALPALVLWVTGKVHWQVNSSSMDFLWSGLFACAAVAVAEEVVFRGVLFQRLIAGLGVWPAQLLIAAYFLLTHSGNPGMDGNVRVLASINIFLASILFGLLYLRTRKLAMPLGLHMMANFVQGSVFGFGVSGHNESGLLQPVFGQSPIWSTGGQFGLEASAPGLVAVILVIGMVLRWKPAP